MSNAANDRDLDVEDRRIGPSRLSTWSPQRIGLLWLLWPGFVVAICVVAALVSQHIHGGFSEAQSALTRGNVAGVVLVMIVPPTYLTALWLRIRHRRRSRPPT